jgi:arginine/ornithine N-succinyltransferase beta subunit
LKFALKSKFDLLWTEEQRHQAAAEGWLLALVVNEGRPVHSAYLDIFDSGPRFANRVEAVRHVVTQAQQRSKLHIEALGACSASKLAAGTPAKTTGRKP